MAIVKPKKVDKAVEGDIIDLYKGRGLSVKENNAVRVSEENSDRVVDATKKITSDFKVIETSCEPIEFGYIDGAPAQCVYSPATGKIKITLDGNDFSDPVKLLDRLKEDFGARLSYDADRIESLVAHELGHCAHNLLALKRCGFEYRQSLSALQCEIFEQVRVEITKEMYEVAFSNETKEDIWRFCEEDLGSMARNPRELIAQSFGNYYYGCKKSKIAKKLLSIL